MSEKFRLSVVEGNDVINFSHKAIIPEKINEMKTYNENQKLVIKNKTRRKRKKLTRSLRNKKKCINDAKNILKL